MKCFSLLISMTLLSGLMLSSPDGKLMASVGSDPDYMLTLWDWKQEKIVLRSKAFSQDIFRVTFSVELEGQLTSSGIGHIRSDYYNLWYRLLCIHLYSTNFILNWFTSHKHSLKQGVR